MDMYQQLLSRFGREFDFRISIWCFEVLQAPTLLEGSIYDAVTADAIIVATHRREDLPDGIKRWVEAWVPRKRGRKGMLIGLLDSAFEEGELLFGVQEYLETAAASAGIDFLVREIKPAQRRIPPVSLEDQPGCRLAPEGWGLNE